MFVMIMIGYIYFAFYGLIICLFVFMKARRILAARRSAPSRLSNQEILQQLRRVKFSEEEFGAVCEENECIICMRAFQVEDVVTRLQCPGNHFYHTRCIELWIN